MRGVRLKGKEAFFWSVDVDVVNSSTTYFSWWRGGLAAPAMESREAWPQPVRCLGRPQGLALLALPQEAAAAPGG